MAVQTQDGRAVTSVHDLADVPQIRCAVACTITGQAR